MAVCCLSSPAFNAPLPRRPGVCVGAVTDTVKILSADTSPHYGLSPVLSSILLQQHKVTSSSLSGIISGSAYVQAAVSCNPAACCQASAEPASSANRATGMWQKRAQHMWYEPAGHDTASTETHATASPSALT